MPIQLGARPDAGFDDPLRLLADCHRRIEMFLMTLVDLAADAEAALLPAQRAALTRSLDYFDKAAPKHTLDEEDSLFPRLRRREDPQLAGALAQLDLLEADHERANALHEEVDRIGRQWLRFNRLDPEAARKLAGDLDQLAALYARHIEVEEQVVFAAAACALGHEDLASIGREMADRRGVPWRPESPDSRST
ncbi:MAG: hemerythrin domain-containing protein [Phycisphaerales bacterium]|nr:hemerythrin domain-containing protein [Phycisphaerales bacterium]